MAKVKTTQFEEQLIRYMLVSEEGGTTNLWFFSQDILMIIPNTLTSVFKEDIKEVYYINEENRASTRATAISLYGVFHLIYLALLKPDRDKALRFKNVFTAEILPRINKEINNPLSEEDKLYLKIIHSETNTEKAYALSAIGKLTNKQKNLDMYKDTVVKAPNTSSTNVFFITDINEKFGFKTGQLSVWLRDQGYFKYGGRSGKAPQILYPGSEFLALYQGDQQASCKSRSKLCVTSKGMELITDKQEEIRKQKRQMKRRGVNHE